MKSNIETLLQGVAQKLSPERYAHTVRVVQQARILGMAHQCDLSQVEVAAALHDCARDYPTNVLLMQAESFGIVLTDVERSTPALLHALVGAEVARREFGIVGDSILSAIRWHTTGRPHMTDLEKVIFLADYTEVGRNFSGVEEVRATSMQNLDAAMFLSLNQTIAYVLQRGLVLHPSTVEARNFLLLHRSSRLAL